MEVVISDFVTDYFRRDKDYQQLHNFVQTHLPTYVATHSSKIKPVRGSHPHLYELRVKVGRESYRLGYQFEQERLQVLFISDILQKVKFDRDFNRYLNHEIS